MAHKRIHYYCHMSFWEQLFVWALFFFVFCFLALWCFLSSGTCVSDSMLKQNYVLLAYQGAAGHSKLPVWTNGAQFRASVVSERYAALMVILPFSFLPSGKLFFPWPEAKPVKLFWCIYINRERERERKWLYFVSLFLKFYFQEWNECA